MINPKQRAKLKSLSQNMDPIINIGKNGITDNLIREIEDLLTSRELIKIKILNNNMDDPKEMIEEILSKTSSDFVSHLGFKFVIFRQNKDPKKRKVNL